MGAVHRDDPSPAAPPRHPRRPTRRAVIRAFGVLLLLPLPSALASLVRRHRAVARTPRRIEITPVGDPVAFVDEVIVCRAQGATRVFAARCTHLGCRITTVVDDMLVCPCHGSRFGLDGSVAAGPASRPLDELPYVVDPRTAALVVHVG